MAVFLIVCIDRSTPSIIDGVDFYLPFAREMDTNKLGGLSYPRAAKLATRVDVLAVLAAAPAAAVTRRSVLAGHEHWIRPGQAAAMT